MSSALNILPQLLPGDRMTRDEFIRRWEALPNLKRAELIDGVVYMPSPLSRTHARYDRLVQMWLTPYEIATPGCEGEVQSTWYMGASNNTPQPDIALAIRPDYGGQSGLHGIYSAGAPELIVEICYSSSAYDLGPKLKLYEASEVREYLALLVEERRVQWRELVDGKYRLIKPDIDGILRSRVFPGLWLDPRALLDGDLDRLIAVVQQGVASPEHAAFRQRLAEEHERRK